jgi:hypothetical protein
MAQRPDVQETSIRNTKRATSIPDGEGIGWETDRPRMRRREIDAGPVNEEASDTGETLPPDYEQVSQNQNRAREGEPSRGAGLDENSGKT